MKRILSTILITFAAAVPFSAQLAYKATTSKKSWFLAELAKAAKEQTKGKRGSLRI